MPINFPSNPTKNQSILSGGQRFVFDGTAWVPVVQRGQTHTAALTVNPPVQADVRWTDSKMLELYVDGAWQSHRYSNTVLQSTTVYCATNGQITEVAAGNYYGDPSQGLTQRRHRFSTIYAALIWAGTRQWANNATCTIRIIGELAVGTAPTIPAIMVPVVIDGGTFNSSWWPSGSYTATEASQLAYVNSAQAGWGGAILNGDIVLPQGAFTIQNLMLRGSSVGLSPAPNNTRTTLSLPLINNIRNFSSLRLLNVLVTGGSSAAISASCLSDFSLNNVRIAASNTSVAVTSCTAVSLTASTIAEPAFFTGCQGTIDACSLRGCTLNTSFFNFQNSTNLNTVALTANNGSRVLLGSGAALTNAVLTVNHASLVSLSGTTITLTGALTCGRQANVAVLGSLTGGSLSVNNGGKLYFPAGLDAQVPSGFTWNSFNADSKGSLVIR